MFYHIYTFFEDEQVMSAEVLEQKIQGLASSLKSAGVNPVIGMCQGDRAVQFETEGRLSIKDGNKFGRLAPTAQFTSSSFSMLDEQPDPDPSSDKASVSDNQPSEVAVSSDTATSKNWGGQREGAGRKPEGLASVSMKISLQAKELIESYAKKNKISFSRAARHFMEQGMLRGSKESPELADASLLPDPKDVVDFAGVHSVRHERVALPVVPLPEKPDFFAQSAHVGSLNRSEVVEVKTAKLRISTDGYYYQEFVLPREEGEQYAARVYEAHPDWDIPIGIQFWIARQNGVDLQWG